MAKLPLLPRHAALAQAILARARSLPADGGVEVRFALSPPELGTVRIRIEARGEQLRIEFVAGSQAAADALGSSLPRLAHNLSQAGCSQAEVTLDLESSTDTGMQTGQQRGEDARRSSDRARAQQPPVAADTPEPGRGGAGPGRLDRMA
jgi:flagellar hook-length control protein FliK